MITQPSESTTTRDNRLDQAQRLREIASINRRRRQDDEVRRSKRIAVTSGKGGVGKSSFALNLAVLTAKLGRKVLLIDADTNLANIDILLGISPPYNISHVISGQKRAQEILVEGPEGIAILPAASGSIEQVMSEGAATESIIADLNAMEEGFDIVIIDTGAGASRSVVDFLLFSDLTVLVTTPEPTAITDAYAMVKLLSLERHDADVRVMVNFARDKYEAVEVYDKLSSVVMHFLKMEIGYLGFMPRDESVAQAVHMQNPLVRAFPKAPASVQLKFISRKLLQVESVLTEEGGIFSALFRRS